MGGLTVCAPNCDCHTCLGRELLRRFVKQAVSKDLVKAWKAPTKDSFGAQ